MISSLVLGRLSYLFGLSSKDCIIDYNILSHLRTPMNRSTYAIVVSSTCHRTICGDNLICGRLGWLPRQRYSNDIQLCITNESASSVVSTNARQLPDYPLFAFPRCISV